MRYFLSKLWQALLTLWGVTTVIFLLFTVLPGDPARMMLDQNEDSAQLAAIKKNMDLTNHCLPNMCTTLMISHQFPFMEIPPRIYLF